MSDVSGTKYYGFEALPVVYAIISGISETEPQQSAFGNGTYQRVVIDYVPLDEDDPTQNGEPASLYLPMPKGYPKRSHQRSMLARWLHQIADNLKGTAFGETFGRAKIKRALQMLEGKYVRMEEVDYKMGGDRVKSYFTITHVFPDRNAAIEAMLAEFGDEDDGDEVSAAASGAADATDELTKAKQVWASLASLGNARETAFRAMQWETDVDTLIAALKAMEA